MWVLSWKKYNLSKFATFVSVIGALTRYGGVMCLASSLIVPGIICIAVGIVIHFLAEAIAKSKAKKVANKAKPAAKPTQPKVAPAQPAPKPPVNQTATQPVAAQPTATQNTVASDGNIKCPNCGKLVPKTNKFCNECGTKVVKERKCLRCGNVLAENDKFCGQCGYQPK